MLTLCKYKIRRDTNLSQLNFISYEKTGNYKNYQEL